MAWRGFKGGCKYGLAGGASAFLYGLVEETWDMRIRKGKVDPVGSMVAGTATAGAFAVVKRMGRRQTWRCLRVGMGLGLVSGILQDLLRWGRGAKPWYVDSLRRRIRTYKEDPPAVETV
jgi:membrane-associated PAP2 superfamily phosphatase